MRKKLQAVFSTDCDELMAKIGGIVSDKHLSDVSAVTYTDILDIAERAHCSAFAVMWWFRYERGRR